MKKEYVVLEIAMDHDAAPSVTLSMLEESVLKANADERSPRSGRDLSYLINSDASKISLSYNEYVALDIRVGEGLGRGDQAQGEGHGVGRKAPGVHTQASNLLSLFAKEG